MCRILFPYIVHVSWYNNFLQIVLYHYRKWPWLARQKVIHGRHLLLFQIPTASVWMLRLWLVKVAVKKIDRLQSYECYKRCRFRWNCSNFSGTKHFFTCTKRVPIVKNMDGRKSGLSGLKNIWSYCKKHGRLEIHGHSKNHSIPKSTKFIPVIK